MRLFIYTSKATSLSEVGRQIAKVAQQRGYSIILHRHMVYINNWRRFTDCLLFVFPYNPMIMRGYMVQYYDAKKQGVKVLWYGVIEGRIKPHQVDSWIRREIYCIACSHYVRQRLEEVGIKVLDVIHHGYPEWEVEVALKEAESVKKKIESEFLDKVVFGVVADVNKRKGFDALARAIEILSAKRDDFVVLVVTKKEAEKHFKGLPNVAIVPQFGSIEHYQVMSFYASIHYLIVSSYAEGFCLPVLEANALGTPVVGNLLPVFEEYADLEHNIFFTPTDLQLVDLGEGILYEFYMYNPEELADAMDYAIDIYKNYKSQYEEMKVKVQEKVRHLTSTNQYTKLLSYFER